MKLIKRRPETALLLTGIAFLVSGIDCQENNQMAIAISSYVVAFINIAACFLVNKHKFLTKISLLFINAVFAFISSYIYFETGKNKIQYGWLAVGILSLILIGITLKKKAKYNQQN